LEAVPRLAKSVVAHIARGALNGRSVEALAETLGLSDRHLRRVLEREVGESPARLARAQRLGRAITLLVEPNRRIIDIAYASGFQSLRRFNAAFREQFGMSPTEWRRSTHAPSRTGT
jgi:AraC family transcriptional regulator, regulatory protein of adaptative response / DNA-3-methyladenine glycosylase II